VKKFPLGRVVATRGVMLHLVSINATAMPYLERHQSGDWGYLGRTDKMANDLALQTGDRLLSKYLLPDQTPIYIITEHDRSYTTILFPHEY
jgi:hypothetical protein